MFSANPSEQSPARRRAYRVHRSKVHGKGVFAQRDIKVSERIVQYRGREISWDVALVRAAERGGPQNHTFFFSLANGNVIDGGDGGNAARWINHSCEPNCEAIEEDDGRIFIYALFDIAGGEELSYSYPLIYEGRHTAAIKRAFVCRCGAPGCTGTMLAPKARVRKPHAKRVMSVDPIRLPADSGFRGIHGDGPGDSLFQRE
ncbi:MAG: SET domain-containing protein-lysine N-methyltransferase [Pseudomonadota bacterium]